MSLSEKRNGEEIVENDSCQKAGRYERLLSLKEGDFTKLTSHLLSEPYGDLTKGGSQASHDYTFACDVSMVLQLSHF